VGRHTNPVSSKLKICTLCTKLSLGGNNDVIYKLFPPGESLVSDIPAGDGNIEKLFLLCKIAIVLLFLHNNVDAFWLAC
jgi:hypothetical protein